MKKLFRSKKAGGLQESERPIVSFWAYLVMAMVCLTFVFLVKSSADSFKGDIEGRVRVLNMEANLLLYLNTRFELNGESITIADLIVESYYADDYDDLMAVSHEVLRNLEKPYSVAGWNVRLTLMPHEEEIEFIRTFDIIGWYEAKTYEFDIMLPDGQNYIKVELILECQDKSCYLIQ